VHRDETMILQPIDVVVWAWLGIAVLSALYVAVDQFRHNPEAPVMKWGFVLVTLYMGPIGLLLYVFADKEPAPGTHERFVRHRWKQGVGSTVHCVAGDATGIIAAAVATALLGFPMWVDVIAEYVFGFAFGLLVFQALFMRKAMGGSYGENVRRSFLPELLSMNLMMAGMAPVMIFLMMGRDMRAMWPGEPLFWFVMSLGVIAGFLVAYPINVWLVAKGLKHGLMTVRDDGRGMAHGDAHAAHASHGHRSAGEDHGGAHQGMGDEDDPAERVTRTQLATLSGVTLLALLAGMFVPAAFVNLRVSAEEVRGAIMPPGMIMTPTTPADAMRDMAAADPRLATFRAPPGARGDRPLAPRVEGGVKVFDLDASVIGWSILPRTRVTAYAINRQVPGSRIELVEGDRVRIHFTNHLPDSASMHWHGLIVPNAMDGPGNITQVPVPPGGRYTYEFVAQQHGTYFYHSHTRPDRQQALGLYGALVIRPRDAAAEPPADHEYVVQLQEWLYRDGLTYPAMLMEGGLPNYFTINGKAYPATDTLRMRVGETLKLRIIGTNNNFIHPMHMHGGPFTVVARDGIVLAPAAQFQADVVNVGPGQRYDVIWPAREPGKWIFHCHIPHHTLNNNVEEQGAGGLTVLIEVSP
jgi:FtsP/CotA-like multicopper oxidase with cupredoxin domain